MGQRHQNILLSNECLRNKHLKFIGLYLAYSYILEEFPLIKANELSSSFTSQLKV